MNKLLTFLTATTLTLFTNMGYANQCMPDINMTALKSYPSQSQVIEFVSTQPMMSVQAINDNSTGLQYDTAITVDGVTHHKDIVYMTTNPDIASLPAFSNYILVDENVKLSVLALNARCDFADKSCGANININGLMVKVSE